MNEDVYEWGSMLQFVLSKLQKFNRIYQKELSNSQANEHFIVSQSTSEKPVDLQDLQYYGFTL